MIRNVLIGCATMVVCIILQCLVVALVLSYLHRRNALHALQATFWAGARLLTETMLILMLGNLIQIAVWSCLFLQLGEFSDFPTAYYHSTVNFSTLGYGDIVMSEKRRLLGGLEAANGVLMFGLTTSALYAVVQALSQQVLKQKLSSNIAFRPGGSEHPSTAPAASAPAEAPPALRGRTTTLDTRPLLPIQSNRLVVPCNRPGPRGQTPARGAVLPTFLQETGLGVWAWSLQA